jgi:hypothetical protein
MRGIMQRPPGTAELLQWLHLAADSSEVGRNGGLQEARKALKRLISVVAKNEFDSSAVARVIDEWSPDR